MNKTIKMVIIVTLVIIVGVVIALKQNKSSGPHQPVNDSSDARLPVKETVRSVVEPSDVHQSKALPQLIDLGADKCIPCKLMAPILEELKTEYAGVFEVKFIDVWKNPNAGKPYKIKMIPTQIFFDPAGKELFRHIGFFSKADILSKWKEFGVGDTKEK
ncbi:thioredoxin family protein [Planctomycetota bacterium]